MMASCMTSLFTNRADFTELSSFTTEASLLGGLNLQPRIPENYFGDTAAFGRALRLVARGVLSTTGTPTFQLTVRLSSTQGSSTITGSILGITAAIVTASGAANAAWELTLDMICGTPGQGTTNATLICAGSVRGPTAFASPFEYALQPTTPESATWTRTLDGALAQYLNLDATCQTSSASNKITCKMLELLAIN